MAVNRVRQREIVEVPYTLPNGQILIHPTLVLSKEEIQDYEDGLFYGVLISSKNYYPELTIPISNSWLNKPLSKHSFFITHIIQQFNVSDVVQRHNTFIKDKYFHFLVEKILDNIIWDK